MRIAFYAPLKPIDHPVPSGDRMMARAFFELLRGLGHAVEIASRLRSYDRSGDVEHQQSLRAAAGSEADRLLAAYRDGGAPDLWFTYHAYHKAPDWLGPAVGRALAIPYVIAEASIAGKQAGGPWAMGHRATIDAVAAASRVLAMTRIDAAGLKAHVTDPGELWTFPPFLLDDVAQQEDRAAIRRRLAGALEIADSRPWLVTVAMMRSDIKLDSYRLLAAALGHLDQADWQLLVAGDGAAAPAVRAALEAAVGDRVRFLGRLPATAVADLCRASDLFVWPALREAYGLAILEALAAGLPVVACREGGVPDLVEDGWNGLLAPRRAADDLASRVDRLLDDVTLRRAMGARARARFLERHSRAAAEARLAAALAGLQVARACS